MDTTKLGLQDPKGQSEMASVVVQLRGTLDLVAEDRIFT